MNDSSTASRQLQIEAIHQSISNGDLTAQQIHDVMLAEITTELSKPQEEVDIDYVNACQALLMELNIPRAAVTPSHYEQNLTAVRKKFQPRFSFVPHTIWGRFATVLCLMVLITTAGLLMPEGWIITRQSEDKGQYIMQGIKTPEGFVSVAEAGPSHNKNGNYTTLEWSEVVYYLGGIPPVPQWLPSGWYVYQYTVGLMNSASTLTVTYAHESKDSYLTYTYYIFFDYDLFMTIEQDGTGIYETLADGTTVYLTTNIDSLCASWYTDHAQFMVTGEMSKENLLRIVESIK